MKFSLKRSFVLSVCQFIIYVSIFYITAKIALMFHEPFGLKGFYGFLNHLLVEISIVSFGVGITFINFLIAAVDKKIFFWSAYGTATLVYVLFHAVNLDHTPYRSTHFIVTGIFAIASVYPVDLIINFVKSKVVRRKSL